MKQTENGRRSRNPEASRRAVLDAAFDEMYAKGFQAAALDAILAKAGVTKGALYHHFGNKAGLGYAVVDERVRPLVRMRYIDPFRDRDDPVAALDEMGARMEAELLKVGILEQGCPLNNLIQEMSGADEGFRTRLAEILDEWTSTIAIGFREAQEAGAIRADVDAASLGAFAVSSYLGAVGIAKNAQDIKPFTDCRSRLADYAESLRSPTPTVSRGAQP